MRGGKQSDWRFRELDKNKTKKQDMSFLDALVESSNYKNVRFF